MSKWAKWLEKRLINFAERDSKVRVSKMIWTFHNYHSQSLRIDFAFKKDYEKVFATMFEKIESF